jgi:CBS domain-containing protein
MKVVGDVMNPGVVCTRPDMSLRDVERLFTDRRITGAPVVGEDGHPVGVVSQHDLVASQADPPSAADSGRFYTDVETYRDIARATIDPSDLRVSQVMTPEVVSVARETPIAEAARLMRDRRVHRLLVTRQGVLVGIVTSIDLLAALDDA